MNHKVKKQYSTAEVAKLLGISRVAVFQKIVEGKIRGTKVGRSYVIDAGDIPEITSKDLSRRDKERIEASVRRTVKEYGETLKRLGLDEKQESILKKKSSKRKVLKFEAITIFPESFDSYMSASILSRAQKQKLIAFKAHNLRDWTYDRHRTVDDKPFGGGPGMLMKPQPFLEALVALKARRKKDGRRASGVVRRVRVIVTAANGKMFTHADAVRLSKYDRLIFLCGRYEGIDQRVIDRLADESFSIGSYVLTGGELPAMVMMDAVARHVPGVLGASASLQEESWADAERAQGAGHGVQGSDAPNSKFQIPNSSSGTGEYPQYTRPEVWLGMKVPEVLLSGNHKKIAEWRNEQRKR